MTILFKQHMLDAANWQTEKVDSRASWFQQQMQALSKLKTIKFASSRERDWPALLEQQWEKIVIFGEHRCQAPEFISAVKKTGKPYLLCERAPLLKNGHNSLYFEHQHLSYNGSFSDRDMWNDIMNKPLSREQENAVIEYRKAISNNSQGIEIQNSRFISSSQIKTKLGIPGHKKIIYMPLQVDEDAVIIDKNLSPWIDSMQQFVDVVMRAWNNMPGDYVLIIKKHPYGSAVQVPQRDNIFYLENEINANSLVQAADCLLSINSGSGTEALVFHKKLISLGKSFYSNKGIHWEAHSQQSLDSLLSNLSELRVDPDRINRFLYEFVFNRIFDFTDSSDRLRWLEQYNTYPEKECMSG